MMGGPELRLLRRNLLTVTCGVGRDTQTRLEQVQVKSEGRRAKTECQNREEWGHHVPNRGGMEKWKKDRVRTSQQEDHCWVEEQAPVEQEAEVERRLRRKRRRRKNGQRVQWACQRPQKKSTEDTRLWEEQGCPAWKWKNRMNDTPIEEPSRRRTLGGHVNKGQFHAAVIQGFWRSSTVGTTTGEDWRRMWHEGHKEN